MNNQKKIIVDNQSFTTEILVDKSPEEVFNEINNVRGWWAGLWSGEVEGDTGILGAEFTYRVPNVHRSKQKITEFIPGKKIIWHVLDADISFVKDKNEWKGTDIVFEISQKGNKTEIRFMHKGLLPELECYSNCSDAWSMLIKDRLRNLITTGKADSSGK